eukprot:SAG31_NODE_13725_length_851_cov_1.001330_1_plen_49_part_00
MIVRYLGQPKHTDEILAGHLYSLAYDQSKMKLEFDAENVRNLGPMLNR